MLFSTQLLFNNTNSHTFYRNYLLCSITLITYYFSKISYKQMYNVGSYPQVTSNSKTVQGDRQERDFPRNKISLHLLVEVLYPECFITHGFSWEMGRAGVGEKQRVRMKSNFLKTGDTFIIIKYDHP